MMFARHWWKNTKEANDLEGFRMDVLKYLAVDFDIKEEDFKRLLPTT